MNYQLDVQGYYKDQSRTGFPHSSGIYFVYRGIYIPHLKTVTLMELLYIGETENLYDRHNEHDKRNEFLARLQEGEELFYSFALTESLSNEQRKKVEAALIYELCPPLNVQNVDSFIYDEITINVLGDRHAYIPDQIDAPSY